jgi:hypothetical protein
VLRSALAVGGIFLITGCGLTSCSNSSTGDKAFNQTVIGEHGSRSSVRFGADAKTPTTPAPSGSGITIPSTTTTTIGF